MNGPINGWRRERPLAHFPAKTQRRLEVAVFLLASLLGIYGLGQGLVGLYERGQEVNLLWLAVTGFAFFVLFAQMGRVHDNWPHRPGKSQAHVNAGEPLPDGDSARSDRKQEN